MTDFEKMKEKLLGIDSPYEEHIHFDIYEWEHLKEIDLRPSTLCDEWIYFEYDTDGNLLRIY